LLRIDSITCIIDAEAIFADGDNEALNLKLRQIGFADLVVLNKVDLVGPEQIEVVKEWIDHHIHRVRIIEATRCDVPLEILLAVGRFDPAHAVSRNSTGDYHNHGHHHTHGAASRMFDTWSYESDQPFSLEALRKMIRKELPASIYRCKGIVFTAESPEERYALQAVGRRVEIIELGGWGERTPQNQLVAIGSSFDTEELSCMFDACIKQ